MADIGLNPPRASNIASRTCTMADALAKFGSVVVWSGSSSHADVATTTSAGATSVAGVVVDQGDPNNSGLHASGDDVTVRYLGDVEINVVAGTYARGDKLITSTTAGAAKKLVGETGNMTIIGECLQDIVLAQAGRVSCKLTLHYAKPA